MQKRFKPFKIENFSFYTDYLTSNYLILELVEEEIEKKNNKNN